MDPLSTGLFELPPRVVAVVKVVESPNPLSPPPTPPLMLESEAVDEEEVVPLLLVVSLGSVDLLASLLLVSLDSATSTAPVVAGDFTVVAAVAAVFVVVVAGSAVSVVVVAVAVVSVLPTVAAPPPPPPALATCLPVIVHCPYSSKALVVLVL